MKQVIKSGAMIAAAAAAMAVSGQVNAAPKSSVSAGDMVHCAGINSCKGTSACATAENACRGQNSCKGRGFLEMKARECLAKDGKIADLDK
ncbi:BufA2 family periplasmic bufferin-type metallophore [Massilia endophytica]|uniref:BufA2 family periplasmic bufferin-type metallophore n=1 Tax=Massilia endophytica TaxID=2899220 RepID=UPI001E58C691|nr:hypothetical protein [Massilia endophytica]UGQ46987.1 hypothetical protein LSQ66_00485 [Massilia endophytica]